MGRPQPWDSVWSRHKDVNAVLLCPVPPPGWSLLPTPRFSPLLPLPTHSSYEEDAPIVAAQTAYGIEAEVEGYDAAYPGDLMTFMDFRCGHVGLCVGADGSNTN